LKRRGTEDMEVAVFSFDSSQETQRGFITQRELQKKQAPGPSGLLAS
jgi:hypothetical protein